MLQNSEYAAESKRAKELAALHQCSLAIIGMTDPVAIGQRVIEVLEQLLSYERGAIVVVNQPDRTLRLLAHSAKGMNQDSFRTEFLRISDMVRNAPSHGVIRTTIEQGKTINISDVANEPRYLVGDERIRSELCVPILLVDRTIGAINVESYKANAFSRHDVNLLTTLANQIALALENARLSELADQEILRRAQAQEDARAARDFLLNAIENLGEGFALFDAGHRLLLCNNQFKALYPKVSDLIEPGVYLEDLCRAATERHQIVDSDQPGEEYSDLVWIAPPDNGGSRVFKTSEGRWIEARDKALETGGQLCIHADITEKKRLELDLIQTQKMEAVGQLTGGVAHDFNNLLGVIIGNAELLADDLGAPNSKMDAVIRAARRGAELTHQLLAFSRKQTLEPKTLDLKASVTGMIGILRRTLGETIEIEVAGEAGLWPCEADPGQMENTILNLAINARDAMPQGGKLTIEFANVSLDDEYAAAQAEVEAGQYVMLAVSDTGEGMDRETLRHAFEPFFTTKKAGEGTGLGLSMVFGFAKQSGGYTTIYSEKGKGTTVKVYLPRRLEQQATAQSNGPNGDLERARGERVLVVEDDADLKTLLVDLLVSLGYEVLAADNGESALACMAGPSQVDLLMTDVVLPGGMSGRELAGEIRRADQGIAVLYMSGYTENAIFHHDRLEEGDLLLQKPFRKTDLAHKVREALDQDGPA